MEQSQRIEDAIYQRGRNRLDPRFEEQRARQTQDLANRGLSLTSEAYTGAEDRLGREQGEQLENLQLSAVEAGAQERSSLFDQALRTRSQLFGEQSTERQMGEQERSNLVREGFTERQVNEMEEMNTFTRAHQTASGRISGKCLTSGSNPKSSDATRRWSKPRVGSSPSRSAQTWYAKRTRGKLWRNRFEGTKREKVSLEWELPHNERQRQHSKVWRERSSNSKGSEVPPTMHSVNGNRSSASKRTSARDR